MTAMTMAWLRLRVAMTGMSKTRGEGFAQSRRTSAHTDGHALCKCHVWDPASTDVLHTPATSFTCQSAMFTTISSEASHLAHEATAVQSQRLLTQLPP